MQFLCNIVSSGVCEGGLTDWLHDNGSRAHAGTSQSNQDDVQGAGA